MRKSLRHVYTVLRFPVEWVAYRRDQEGGTRERGEGRTELVVASGQAIAIGGSGGGTEVVRQFLLGYKRVNGRSQVSSVLTPEVR